MRICFGLSQDRLSLAGELAQTFQAEVVGVASDGEALLALARSAKPDAVVLEDCLRTESLAELAEELTELGLRVVVLAGLSSAAQRERLKSLGLSLVWAGGADVLARLGEALELPRRPLASQMTIVAASVKGGVGKTFLAVNLAMAIKDECPEARVILVDAHPEGDVGALLGVNDGLTLGNLAASSAPVTSVQALAPFIHKHESGVDLLLAPRRLGREVMPDRERFLALLRELKLHYDVVVIDTTTELDLAPTVLALDQAGTILLVTTPNVLSVRKLLQFKPVLEELGLLERCRLVVNMVVGRVSTEELSKEIGRPVAAHVPYDPAVLAAENSFQAVVLQDNCRAGQAVRKLAAALLRERRQKP